MPTKYYFLDVGQGQAAICVETTTGQSIIVDCAGGALKAIEQNYSLDSLDVRIVFVTHLDWDHCADLMNIVRVLEPSIVRLNTDTAWRKSDKYLQLRSLLRGLREWSDSQRPQRFKTATAEIDADKPTVAGMSWKLHAPEAADIARAHESNQRNYASAVLRVSAHATSVLFTGDTNSAVLSRIVCDDDKALASDVLVYPHHGGKWADSNSRLSQNEILRSIGPRVVIFSAGARNAYGHPFPDNVAAITGAAGARVMCTEVTPRCFGADTLESHRKGASGESALTPPDNASCAGTIVVNVDALGFSVEPDVIEHNERIGNWPRPCCRVDLQVQIGLTASERTDEQQD